MIVRILGEGQLEVPDRVVAEDAGSREMGADRVQYDLSSEKALDGRDECDPADERRWHAD